MSVILYPPIRAGTSVDPITTHGDGYQLYSRSADHSWIVISHWSPEVDQALRQSRPRRVLLDSQWAATDLDALLPYAGAIEELALDGPQNMDTSALAELPALRLLELHADQRVPFHRLFALRECMIMAPARLGSVCETPALEHLNLQALDLRDLSALASMATLKSLTLGGMRKLRKLDGIEGLPLVKLALFYLTNVESVTPLTGLPLQTLTIDSSRSATGIESSGEIASLRSLELENVAAQPSLQFLSRLTELRTLSVSNTALTHDTVSVEPLLGLTHLRELTLRGGTKKLEHLTGVESLGQLLELEGLQLQKGPKHIDSIGWVSSLHQLQSFLLQGTRIRDGNLAPLLKLPKLKEVVISPVTMQYTHTDSSFRAALSASIASR